MRRSQHATAAMERLKGPGGRAGGCCRSARGWRALLLPQQNRQSLYMYGSEVAVEQECRRQLQSGVFVIHPFSLMRSYYIMGMMAVTFLNLIGIPMEIAFLDGTSGLAWEGFNVFSDTLFLVDVALNFRMGIIPEDGEEAILDIKQIRVSYLRTWFIPDVIAAFPIGYILLFAGLHYHNDDNPSKTTRMMRILMFVRILSLIRLARVSRLVRFFNEVEKVSNANLEVVRLFFRVLSLFMMIFLLCHWNGCIQYFVPMLEEFPTDCWVRKENLMMSRLEHYMTFMKLPPELQLRITNYYQARYGGKWFDEQEVMHTVSSALKEQLLTVMCSRLLRNMPLFRSQDENFLNSVIHELEYELYQEGDVIVREGAPGDRMFFIDHGQVLEENDSFRRELCDGDFFGEVCVLSRGKHLATVKALTDCQCFSLSWDDFQEVLQGFPDVRKDLEEMMEREYLGAGFL
ncbi:hyperpolarization activated cyclic nucleotide-gated potassium channel 5 isoform X2 [Nerophis lumbriciformis]|uniref:hyperpolarization activated cyclic nucleotide-gated potassium channel 5 isoform X2 n=1 Tax=Nerophis lumbriciformis TaxID=546530 RepID=UPI002AE072CF|nr:potassium/sodium hyperpolarization-activated cyclic nucleotide-gated channel 2 isoform X2 [Nerophis lumbriciformis]